MAAHHSSGQKERTKKCTVARRDGSDYFFLVIIIIFILHIFFGIIWDETTSFNIFFFNKALENYKFLSQYPQYSGQNHGIVIVILCLCKRTKKCSVPISFIDNLKILPFIFIHLLIIDLNI